MVFFPSPRNTAHPAWVGSSATGSTRTRFGIASSIRPEVPFSKGKPAIWSHREADMARHSLCEGCHEEQNGVRAAQSDPKPPFGPQFCPLRTIQISKNRSFHGSCHVRFFKTIHSVSTGCDGSLKNNPKKSTKWIDPRRSGSLGSPRRHDGGRPRDRQSIAVLTTVKPPDWLFSPLETSSLTVWLSGNRAKSDANRMKAVLSRRDDAEKRKKIKLCAAHLISISKQCAEVNSRS